MPFPKSLAKKIGSELLELGKAFPDQPSERRRVGRALIRLGKKFPEQRVVPGYRELEPQARKLVQGIRGAPRELVRQTRKDLSRFRKALDKHIDLIKARRKFEEDIK